MPSLRVLALLSDKNHMRYLGWGANSSTNQCKDETAGADFGAQLAFHGPKADWVSPTTVGECISQEPALVPSWDAVTGSTMEYTNG